MRVVEARTGEGFFWRGEGSERLGCTFPPPSEDDGKHSSPSLVISGCRGYYSRGPPAACIYGDVTTLARAVPSLLSLSFFVPLCFFLIGRFSFSWETTDDRSPDCGEMPGDRSSVQVICILVSITCSVYAPTKSATCGEYIKGCCEVYKKVLENLFKKMHF